MLFYAQRKSSKSWQLEKYLGLRPAPCTFFLSKQHRVMLVRFLISQANIAALLNLTLSSWYCHFKSTINVQQSKRNKKTQSVKKLYPFSSDRLVYLTKQFYCLNISRTDKKCFPSQASTNILNFNLPTLDNVLSLRAKCSYDILVFS